MHREKGRPVRAVRARVAIAWVAGMMLSLAAGSHAAEFRRGPAPAWVVQQALDEQAQPALGKGNQGVHYLLVDQQTRLEPHGRSTWRRVASRALNLRGVESESHLAIEFDPSHESLTLHMLNVHRDGRIQDRLPSAQIKVLQRESDLEYRIYDGSKTVDIVLADIRPGDVVDYAYSRAGDNPVFGGRAFGRMELQWSVPVHAMHHRLLAPSNRTVLWRASEGAPAARVERRGGWTEHVWRATDVDPVPQQKDTPRWYDAFASVSWSEFADWAAVARWAEPLYSTRDPAAGPLRAEIDRIAASALSPEQRLLATLAFVQSQIRYLGVEVGPGSHAPRPPEKVLALRYGDCKDKVLLAVTMLRALGVPADPALVHTRLRDHVGDRLPSPGAFNHVILRAQVGDRTVWVDPTRSLQQGRLDHIAQADFGQALLLDGRSTTLEAMPAAPAARRSHDIAMVIDASRGFDKSPTLDVTSTYQGDKADEMRDTLRNDSLADLQSDYLNFYLRSYPGLRVAKPFSFEDDEAGNRLVTHEHYRLDTLVAKDADDAKPPVYLRVPDIRSLVARPDDTVRSAPLRIDYPKNVTVSLTALLPDAWALKTEHTGVSDPAFEFSADSGVDTARRTLLLKYHYRSLSDHVPPARLAAYIDHLEQARDQVGYRLNQRKPAAGAAPSTRAGLAGGLLALLACMVLAGAGAVVLNDTQRDAQRTGTDLPAGLLPNWKLLAVGATLWWGALLLCGVVAVTIWNLYQPPGLWNIGLGLCAWMISNAWRHHWKEQWLAWAAVRTGDARRLARSAARLGLPGTGAPAETSPLAMSPDETDRQPR
jgi:transglutaminase-like putative cysteine protease